MKTLTLGAVGLALTAGCTRGKSEGLVERERASADGATPTEAPAEASLHDAAPRLGDAPKLTIINAEDGGSLQSGFLIGTAGSERGIDRVEVALDDQAFIVADGGAAWSLKLPVGPAWRQGTAHKIVVRSIDVRGIVSAETTLDVRRGANADVNGDGFVDVVMAAPRNAQRGQVDEGAVYVFYGTGRGISPQARRTYDAETVISGAVAHGFFGAAVALADVDGDGYADLVAGAPGAGKAHVFFGRAGGLASGAVGAVPANTLEASDDATAGVMGRGRDVASKGFGRAIVTGDFDGDGIDDLAVADDAHHAFAYRGSDSGPTDAQSLPGPQYPTGLLAADVDGDGFADLVVGDPREGERGVVRIHHGHAGGVPRLPTQSILDAASGGTPDAPSARPMAGFGAAVAAGDINGDLFIDLIVAAASARGSELRVFHGGATGIQALGGRAGARLAAPGAEAGKLSLAACDLDGNGSVEVIVAAPRLAAERGALVVVKGGRGAWPVQGKLSEVAAARLEGADPGDHLGEAIRCQADLNGDGRADLVAGAPGNRGHGRVYVLLSEDGAWPLLGGIEATAVATIEGEFAGSALGGGL